MMHNFRDGLALAYTGNQKYGYVNTRGEWVIAPEYDFACDFSEGMALVGDGRQGGANRLRGHRQGGTERFSRDVNELSLTGGCFLVVYSCTKICGNTIVLVWIKKGKPCCIFPPRYRK